MQIVTLYRKPGCPLCDQAAYYLQHLLAARPDRAAWQLESVNILADPTLFRRYRYGIPAVVVNGGAVLRCPYSLDVAALCQILHGR
ncbi:MAG: glutaredoxin family protein [Chloroflexota bacterium]|nr:glutaredoxin family protein [Chloroflexota bacterium]